MAIVNFIEFTSTFSAQDEQALQEIFLRHRVDMQTEPHVGNSRTELITINGVELRVITEIADNGGGPMWKMTLNPE